MKIRSLDYGPQFLLALALGLITLALAATELRAQERSQRSGGIDWSTGIGGSPSNRREIFGLDEMPPAPKDFGPHFDHQPYPLEGGVNKAPYMH